ncbi:SoxR reducing system RseC family protein [Halomonas sp. HL-93]|uniref:SoxR reducing system RseC family protein n=1 Tax=Halomonas sp. HL-93 TaxID=1666906 RepID=UPI0006D9495B|nr:SoxR reducing system RseC family protein [Halomonas sp. HL-93]KPQ26097.1 MAG: sigma-E factor negative regulatory protein RseC [Halomonas sp. HL-93]SBR49440.1 positive regulator of sigma(E), RseC/MucC [Halomonas sp. HL-93]
MSVASNEAFIKRQGRVVGYHAHGVIVEVAASPGCMQCAKGQGCGAGLLERRPAWQVSVDTRLPRDNDDELALNSEVTLVMLKASMTRLAWLVYGLPLLMALAIAGLFGTLSDEMWLAPSLFFSVLISGMIGLKYALGRRAEHFRPRLADAS